MKTTDTQTAEQLLAKDAEIADLRARLEEAEETLRAIREGEVDAVIVSGSKGDRVFALSESDNLHRLMVETMNEAGLAATPEGLLVFCNDRAAALFGRTKEQLLGHDLAEFAAPSEAERVRGLLRTASAAPSDARIEFRASAGMPVPMHVWASRLERPGSPLICLVATDLSRIEADRDLIAQLQRQQQQLRESESRFRSLFESSPDAIFLATPGGPVTHANPAACAVFGMTEEELCRAGRKGIEDPVDPRHQAAVAERARFGKVRYEATHVRNDGSKFPSEVSSVIVEGGTRSIVILRDITERKWAEEALHASEERLRLAQGYGGVGVWDWNVQNEQLAFEPELEQLYGLAPGSIRTYHDWASHVHPDDLARVEAERATALDGRQPFQVEFRIRHATGAERWIMAKGRGEYDVAGRLLYVRGVNIDITESKQSEALTRQLHEAIAQEKDRLSALVYSIVDEIWFADATGQFTLVNPVASSEFALSTSGGADVRELAASLEVLRPDGSPRPIEEAPPLRALRGEMVRNQEEQVRTPATGELRWRQVSAAPVRDARGKIIGSVSVVRDITERKRNEEAIRTFNVELEQRVQARTAELERANLALRRSQELLNETQRISKVGGWEYDVAARRVSWTEEVYRIHGVTADYNPSQPEQDIQFYAPDDRPRVADAFRRALEEGTPYDLEVQLITAQGARLWVRTKGQPECENGKVVRVSGNIADISEIRSAQAALTEANAALKIRAAELAATNRELEAFCYSVSHDLRTPLRSMDGFSQALLEDYGPVLDATGKDFLQRVRSSSQRMGRLIDDLLNLSRLTRAQVRHTTVDLTALAESIVSELLKAEPSRSVDVRIAPGLTATGDPTLLGTALSNLLENAWKFTGHRPDAAIEFGMKVIGHSSLGESQGTDSQSPMTNPVPPMTNDSFPMTIDPAQPVFYVRDNGAGFDMRYADKLFTPFQRLHAVEDFPGTGIGLATVQRVIHRHGGRVWFESAPGKGTTFYFTVGAGTRGLKREPI